MKELVWLVPCVLPPSPSINFLQVIDCFFCVIITVNKERNEIILDEQIVRVCKSNWNMSEWKSGTKYIFANWTDLWTSEFVNWVKKHTVSYFKKYSAFYPKSKITYRSKFVFVSTCASHLLSMFGIISVKSFKK
jgi:hypothetical protein